MLKKSTSLILLVVFMLASMRVTVAAHYCGGELVDWKVSMGGTLAGCGMEEGKPGCPGEAKFAKDCCKDFVGHSLLSSSIIVNSSQHFISSDVQLMAPFVAHDGISTSKEISTRFFQKHKYRRPPLLTSKTTAVLQVFQI